MTQRILVCLAALALGCSSSDSVCEPGATQPCVCPGSGGAQTCNADGTGWGACVCGDAGDAGDAGTECTDQCAAEDLTQCGGTVIQMCRFGADGCLRWTDGEDCAVADQGCDDSGDEAVCASTGTCSVTGETCLSSAQCPTTPVEGLCIVQGDAPGTDWACGYDPRVDTGMTATCEGQTVGRCREPSDCPPDSECRSLGPEWCGETATVCHRSLGGSCTADAQCTYTPDNACVICGDGVVASPFEQCDDGNRTSGDLCDENCGFEGVCRYMGTIVACECATNADCEACWSGSTCGTR